MKTRIIVSIIVLTCLLGVDIVNANKPNVGPAPSITVSPNTLVLSAPIRAVTVHSNIPCSLVNRDTVELNGIEPYLTFADNMGHLVAKFKDEEVKDIVEPGYETFTLTGTMLDGQPFAAMDVILVRE